MFRAEPARSALHAPSDEGKIKVPSAWRPVYGPGTPAGLARSQRVRLTHGYFSREAAAARAEVRHFVRAELSPASPSRTRYGTNR